MPQAQNARKGQQNGAPHVEASPRQRKRLWVYGLAMIVVLAALAVGALKFAPALFGLGNKPEERLSCSSAAASRADHPKHDVYQDFLERKVATGALPGITLLIKSPKGGLWFGSAGVANLETGLPMTPCTRSRVGSITKIFTSVVVLKMVEQGRLDLSKGIREYLPHSVWTNIQGGDRITLRQLLNHTSGIPDYVNDSVYLSQAFGEPERKWTMNDVLPYIVNHGSFFPPGEGFYYSNSNYILLGMILLGATGRDPSELITEWIIKPLGLNDTYYDAQDPVPNGTARGYVDFGGGLQDGTRNTFAHYTPDGAIVSTVYDLSAFIEALFEGKLLGEAMMKEMTTWVDMPTARFGRTKYGLGLRYWDTPFGPAYGHSGQVVGYSADLFYFPNSKLSYALLTNASNGMSEQIIDYTLTTEMPLLLFEPEKLP